jgi:biotin transport system substrate-specific component
VFLQVREKEMTTLVLKADQQRYWEIVFIFGASILLSLCSQISIPLFFTPVPLVVQNSLAIAMGAILGPRKGSVAVALFLLYGWMTFPVFAGGASGVTVLTSLSSGGYLFGYCVAAFLTGILIERFPSQKFFALLIGHLTVLVLGSAFFAVEVGLKDAVYLGFFPFILSDILKVFVLSRIC